MTASGKQKSGVAEQFDAPVVILFHGFTSTPNAVRPLARTLSALGYHTYTPTLAGHHTSVADLATTGWHDWVQSAIDAVEEIKVSHPNSKLVLCGISMGATISYYISAEVKADSLVLIAPAKGLAHTRFLQLLAKVLKVLGVEYFPKLRKSQNGVTGKGSKSSSYTHIPLTSALEVMDFISRVAPKRTHTVTCPTLVIQTGRDGLLDTSSIKELLELFPTESKELQLLPKTRHNRIIVGKNIAILTKMADDFIKTSSTVHQNKVISRAPASTIST